MSIDEFLKTVSVPSKAFEKRYALAGELLSRIKAERPKIAILLNLFKEEEPDLVYRFYHQSYKVFIAVSLVKQAKDFFAQIAPAGVSLNEWFLEIADTAIGKVFDDGRTNNMWLEETRPILEALWHSKYFLEQMAEAADQLAEAPQVLPSGWAAVLYLYNLR